MIDGNRIALQPGEVLLVHRRADRVRTLRQAEVEQLAYHLARVLTGEPSAASEWEHLGFEVAIRPAKPGPAAPR